MVSDAQATFLIKLMAQEDISRVMRQLGTTSVTDLTRLQRVIDGTRTEISGTAASAALLGKRLDESNAGARRAAGGAELYADALDDVGDEAGQATLQLTRLDARGTRAFNRLRRAARGFGRSLGRTITSPLTQITGLLGTFAGIQGLRVVTNDAADLQTVMGEVATILPEAAGGAENLDRRVKDLAASQGQLETDVGRGLYQAISAGFTDTGAALSVVGQGGKLAVAGLTDTGSAVDLLTTSLNAYKRTADDSEEISDDLFTTVRVGKTTITELGTSIGQTLPLASALGVTFKENNAALATQTQLGFDTGRSATGLKALYSALTREGDKLDEVLQRIGKGYDENTVRQQGLLPVLRDVRTASRSNAEVLEVLGGNVEAYNALLSLTGENLPLFTSSLQALENSAGATDAALEKIIGRDAFKVQATLNAIRIEALAMGDAILKGAADGIDGLGGIEGVQERVRVLFTQISPLAEQATEDAVNFFTSFGLFQDDLELASLKAERFAGRIDRVIDRMSTLLGLRDQEPSSLIDAADISAFERFISGNANLQDAASGRKRFFLSDEEARQFPALEQGLIRVRELTSEIVDLRARNPTLGRLFPSLSEKEQAVADRLAEMEARRGELAKDNLALLNRAVDIQRARHEEIEAAAEAEKRHTRELNEKIRLLEKEQALRRRGLAVDRDRADGVNDDRFLGALRDQAGQLGDFLTDNIDPAVARQNALVLALTGRWGEAVATLGTAEPELVDLNRLTGLLGEEWAKVLARMREAPDAVQQTAEQEREFRSLLLGIDAQVARSDAEKLDVLQRQLALQAELATTKAEELGASDEELALLRQRLELLRELQLGEFGKKPGERATGGGTPGEGGPDALEQLRKQRELNLQVTSIQAQIEGAAETATGALFEDFIIGAKSAKDAFRDFAEEVVRQLVRIAAQAAASQLFQAVFGVAAGVATGGLAGVGVAAAGTAASQPVENAKGGVTPAIGPPIPVHFYASGGVGGVARGTQAAIFGEGKNFEAYVPLPDNQRIPVQLSGAQGVTIIVRPQVIVRPFDASDFRSRIPEFSREIGDALGREVRNNPHVRATIRGLGSGRG